MQGRDTSEQAPEATAENAQAAGGGANDLRSVKAVTCLSEACRAQGHMDCRVASTQARANSSDSKEVQVLLPPPKKRDT